MTPPFGNAPSVAPRNSYGPDSVELPLDCVSLWTAPQPRPPQPCDKPPCIVVPYRLPAASKTRSPMGSAPSLPPVNRYRTVSVQPQIGQFLFTLKIVPQPMPPHPCPPPANVSPYRPPSWPMITLDRGDAPSLPPVKV